jgi:Protein of unknown function (DUF3800)
MIWTACIDESGTHDSPIMLMGGYLGNEDQWKKFNSAWKAVLDSEGLTGCHAKALMHSAKEFQGWSRDRRSAFAVKAQEIISESLQFGFTSIIRQNDYNELYKGQPKTFKLREDTIYGILFRGCLLMVELAVTGNQRPPPDLRLDITLEKGNKNSGDANRLFELAKREHLPGCEHVLGTFTLSNKSEYGLQAADLLVYSANKLEKKEHWTQPTDIERSSFVLGQGEPAPVGFKEYRFPIRRKSLQMLRADFLLPDSQRKHMQSK